MNLGHRVLHIGRSPVALAFCLLALSIILSESAYAGTGGKAFDDVWETLVAWTQGTFGRIVAGAIILVGIVAGVARQSLMAFAVGIAGGMGLYNIPGIIETIVSATLEHAPTASYALELSNGLG